MSNSSQWSFRSSFRWICAATFAVLTLAACGGGSADGVSAPPVSSGPIQAQLQAPLTVVAGQPFSLDARSSAPGVSGGALKYNWELGTARASAAQIGHVYDMPGSYDVTLRIQNERGEISTTTQRIVVTAAPASALGTVSVVVSGRNGEAISGAEVVISGRGAFTDANGLLDVGSVPVGQPWVIRVTKAGFAPSVVRGGFAVGATEYLLPVLLTALDTPAQVDLAQAIDESNNGLRLRIPAGSLGDASGNPATGMASVYINSDPSNTSTHGIKFGTDMLLPNGSLTQAISMKPFDIVIKQGNIRLNLLPGKTAQLDWDLAPTAAGDQLPDGTQLALRTLDESTGLWRQEGVATVVSPPGEDRSIRATVGHFSYWDPTAPSAPDFIRPIYACEIDISGGLPTLQLGQTPYCTYMVQYRNPYYDRYGGLVPEYVSCYYNPYYLGFGNECSIPRNTAFNILAHLKFTADTTFRKQQSFAANTERPVVSFTSSALIPLQERVIIISASGGNVLGNQLFARGAVELKANFRSTSGLDGPVEFLSGGNVVLGTASLRTPTFTFDAADGSYNITARIKGAGNTFYTSSNVVIVMLDKTPATVEIRNPSSPNDSINNATGIPLDAALSISAGEPFVSTPSVTVSPNIAGVLSRSTDSRWIFTPQGNWQPLTNYSLTVNNIMDRAGNVSAPLQVSFRTAAAPGVLQWSTENTLQPTGFLPAPIQLNSAGYVLYLAARAVGGSALDVTVARLDGTANTTTVLGTLGASISLNADHAQITGNHAVFAERLINPGGVGGQYSRNLKITTAVMDANTLTRTVLVDNTQVFASLSASAGGFSIATNMLGDLALSYADTTGLWLRTYIEGTWQAPVQIHAGQIAGSFKVSMDSSRIARVYWTRINSAVPATPYVIVLSELLARASSATNTDVWTNLSLTPDSMTLLTNQNGTNLMGFSYQRNSRNLVSAAYQDGVGIGYMLFEAWATGQASFSINPSGLAAVAYSQRSNSFEVSSIRLTTRSGSVDNPTSRTVRDYVNDAPVVPDADRTRNPYVSLSNSGLATVGGMLRRQTSDMYQLQLPSGAVADLPDFAMNTTFGIMQTLDSGEVIFLSGNRWRSLR